MNGKDYRSLLPEITMPRVRTIISDESLVDVLKDDGFISCPDIPLGFVDYVLKAYKIVYDNVYYYGTSLSVHLYFKGLPLSLASSIMNDLNRKFLSSSYCVRFPQVLSYDRDKVQLTFSICKKL